MTGISPGKASPLRTVMIPSPRKVLEIVAAKTGYPQDMLDLDLDLEADLGIDTVKQAETFAAIREAFGIPVQQSLSLRDYPTLKHVIGFVFTMRPELAAAGPTQPAGSSRQETAAADGAAMTGIRQSQCSAASTAGPIPSPPRCSKSWRPRPATRRTCSTWTSTWRPTWASTPSSRPRRSLRSARRSTSPCSRASPCATTPRSSTSSASSSPCGRNWRPRAGAGDRRQEQESAAGAGVSGQETAAAMDAASSIQHPASSIQHPVQQPASGADPVAAKVLEIVAAKTGYPQDMLDLDLDLEADLGIDTVKQAETFAAIREAFDIPVQQSLSLRDYPTLKHVIGFVFTMRPELAAGQETGAGQEAGVRAGDGGRARIGHRPSAIAAISHQPSAISPARPSAISRCRSLLPTGSRDGSRCRFCGPASTSARTPGSRSALAAGSW